MFNWVSRAKEERGMGSLQNEQREPLTYQPAVNKPGEKNVKKTKCLNVINVEFIHMTPLAEKAFSRPIPKFIVFLIVMYRYESWTRKKAECQKKMMFLNCGDGENS